MDLQTHGVSSAFFSAGTAAAAAGWAFGGSDFCTVPNLAARRAKTSADSPRGALSMAAGLSFFGCSTFAAGAGAGVGAGFGFEILNGMPKRAARAFCFFCSSVSSSSGISSEADCRSAIAVIAGLTSVGAAVSAGFDTGAALVGACGVGAGAGGAASVAFAASGAGATAGVDCATGVGAGAGAGSDGAGLVSGTSTSSSASVWPLGLTPAAVSRSTRSFFSPLCDSPCFAASSLSSATFLRRQSGSLIARLLTTWPSLS